MNTAGGDSALCCYTLWIKLSPHYYCKGTLKREATLKWELTLEFKSGYFKTGASWRIIAQSNQNGSLEKLFALTHCIKSEVVGLVMERFLVKMGSGDNRKLVDMNELPKPKSLALPEPARPGRPRKAVVVVPDEASTEARRERIEEESKVQEEARATKKVCRVGGGKVTSIAFCVLALHLF